MDKLKFQVEDSTEYKILQAAIQLFQKYGLTKVTMDDVAKAIGKGRSSLYYYYKSREEVFEAVMHATIQQIIQEITKAVQSYPDLTSKIQIFSQTKLKTSNQWQSFFRALENGMGVAEINKHAQTMNTFHLELMQKETEILQNIFEQAILNGQIPKTSQKDLSNHIAVYLCSIRGIKREHINNNKDFKDLAPLINTLSNMLIKSLQ